MQAAGRTDHALERLVFFSDAVFAIAVTLLILEVHVPQLPRDGADAVYVSALVALIPSFIGYAISFWVVGMFWLGHHRAFSLAIRHSRRVLGWNLLLLGVIAFMPFATAFWALNMGSRVPALFYCVTLLIAAVLNAQVVRIATGAEMVDPAADPALIAYCRRRGLSVVLGAACAILLGIFSPRYAQVALVSIPVWRRLLMIGKAPPAA